MEYVEERSATIEKNVPQPPPKKIECFYFSFHTSIRPTQ